MITAEDLIAENPFPGLRSFMPGEADRFFGREQQIRELLTKLAESPFVAVAGASGCGKSSLVLAGLLSELAHQRAIGGGIEWRPVVMRPGHLPIASLAARLAPVLSTTGDSDETRVASLDGRLRLGGLALVEAVRTARLPAHVRILVVVDQFEEIFRFKKKISSEEATAFVKLLLHAACDPDSPVSVVLTLRSDALGFCADFRDLPEMINRGQYLVPKLTREQRKEAIVKPVELRGFSIAPRLVQRLLNDVTDDYDDLPVMQHVLTRTWQCWAEASQGARSIDLDDYNATGTAANALSRHADEAHDSLIGLGAVVEKIFRALTERVAEGTEIRRPLTERVAEGTEIRRPLDFKQLCSVTGYDDAKVGQVVERFRRADTAFLMPSTEVALSTNPMIDISHESLIRLWQKLRQWTRREAESRANLLRLVEAAHRYFRQDGDLLGVRDLEHALGWRNNEQPTVAWVSLCTDGDGASRWQSAQTFLADSEQAANRERRRERMQVWRWRGLALLVVVVSVAAAAIGFNLQKQAKSHALASLALLDMDHNPAASAHLALAALDQDPENMRAEFALRQSLATLEIAHVEHVIPFDKPIVDARFTRDESRLVVASGKTVTILDAQSYKTVGLPFNRDEEVYQAWLIANNTLLVTRTADGQVQKVQIQNVDGSRPETLSCEGEKNFIYMLAVSVDERHIAAGCYNGEIAVWDVEGTKARRQPSLTPGSHPPVTITALSFSADNDYLASGDADGVANIWKLGQSRPWIGAGQKGTKESPIGHKKAIRDMKAIRDITFHPTDSKFLATASDDHTAIVWQLDLEARGLLAQWTLKHDRPVTVARFTPRKDAHPLMTISDKRVRFWRDEDFSEVRGHDDWVTDVSVSDKGELAVSASSDGTAKVWSTRNGTPIALLGGHRDQVSHAFFAPGGRIVTASLDGYLRFWRLNPPQLLASGSGWMLSATFDPAGKRIALCGERQPERQHCSIIDAQDISMRPTTERESLEIVEADAVTTISWSPDGRLLMGHREIRGLDSKIIPVLWDVESRRVITPAWLAEWDMTVFSPRTPELLTSKLDGNIALWNIAALADTDPDPIAKWKHLPSTITYQWPAMSPDGQWIAASGRGKVTLWDRKKPGAEPRMLEGHGGDIRSIRFSRDSRWLVTASTDRTARIWPVDQAPGQAPFVELAGGHGAALSSAAFNYDGGQVITSSADKTIRVWDARKGHELASLSRHGDAVNEVQFDLDGQRILSASDDGTVKLGRCEACNQTVVELRQRVRDEVKLTPDEKKKLEERSHVATPFFKLPAFLARER